MKLKDVVDMPMKICKHNSIPTYFDGTDDGCINCATNTIIAILGEKDIPVADVDEVAENCT